ncbi:hypothetical protein CAE01nite_20660 [Cellulomonas aerilata]|uniref:Uncharacterized protein n=1 Tax=Cellulomonas aerilata TaxID=515326 RepID=A0A512DCZ5_9CELL|nr:hypothetical protein CAE01nite_20660 [Cellulomonas aerilata]
MIPEREKFITPLVALGAVLHGEFTQLGLNGADVNVLGSGHGVHRDNDGRAGPRRA